MLRKIIMSLGLFVAFLPYLGIPRSIDAVVYTVLGLLIFFLLIFSKKPKHIQVPIVPPEEKEQPVKVSGIPTFNELLEGKEKEEKRDLPVSRAHEAHVPKIDAPKVSEMSDFAPDASIDAPVVKKTVRRKKKVPAEEIPVA